MPKISAINKKYGVSDGDSGAGIRPAGGFSDRTRQIYGIGLDGPPKKQDPEQRLYGVLEGINARTREMVYKNVGKGGKRIVIDRRASYAFRYKKYEELVKSFQDVSGLVLKIVRVKGDRVSEIRAFYLDMPFSSRKDIQRIMEDIHENEQAIESSKPKESSS